jgi:hypothetical protein
MASQRGDFAVAIAGESQYQIHLRSICGPGKVKHACRAVLRLEFDNQFDPNAVRVEINGKPVGYLTRDYAPRYRHQVDITPEFDGTCDALIIGGGPGKDMVGVWLDLPDLTDEPE